MTDWNNSSSPDNFPWKRPNDTVNNYPFSDELVFCTKHSSQSDIVDVDQCQDCSKPGYKPNHSLSRGKR